MRDQFLVREADRDAVNDRVVGDAGAELQTSAM
jgi:hypothetical protein